MRFRGSSWWVIVLVLAVGGQMIGAGGSAALAQNSWEFNPATGNYYRMTDPLPWDEAEAQAVAWGGHLVTLDDAEEETWIKDTFGAEEYFWIGFNDIAEEGTWVWSSGTPVTYTNWAQGEPNDFMGEDAAIMNWPFLGGEGFGDYWNDAGIGNGFRGIAELGNPTFTVFMSADFSFTEGIGGFDFLPTSQVTLTIDLGGNGSIDFEDTAIVDAGGGVGFPAGFPTVQEGDVVTLTDDLDPPRVKSHVVGFFTLTEVDPVADALAGTGREGTQLFARAIDPGLPFPQGPDVIVVVDGAGNWAASFAGAYDIVPGTEGWVQTNDADGDHTQINWWVPPPIGPIDPIVVEAGDIVISQTDGVLWVYDPLTGDLDDNPLPFGGTWDIQWAGPDSIYIANSGDARIWELDLPSGELELIAEGDPFGFPIGLALDPTDDLALWVADSQTGILRIDLSTGQADVVVPDFGGVDRADGIAVDSGGSVFFTDLSPRLYRVAPEAPGGYEIVLDVDGYGLNGLVFENNGTLLATSMFPSAVIEIDVSAGAFTVHDFATEMRSSEDTAVANNGDWWVIDSGFVSQFGDDSGLYLSVDRGQSLEEELRGEPLGDTVDLLIVRQQEVAIDIKPGSDANPINTKGKGVIPVAILGSDSFGVSTVNTATVRFGPLEAIPKHQGGHLEDVNLDGYVDLLFHFPVQDTGLMEGDTHACLDGLTVDGSPFQGCDAVTIVR